MTITTVLLIKDNSQNVDTLNEYYFHPLASEGIPRSAILVLPLLYSTGSKIPAKTAKAYLDKLLTKIPDTVTNLIIADSPYFKFITGIQKVSKAYGAVVPGGHKGYETFNCAYVPNYRSLFRQPENAALIEIGLKAIAGTASSVLINSAEYGFKFGSDREILDSLFQYPVLSADIETTGLEIDDKVVSIAFAWTKHDGVAIDLSITGSYYTKKFLEQYKGTLIWHGGLYDAKLLIRNLWMEHESDWQGMLEGLHYFRDMQDTQLLAYLAKNATTQVSLGLKDLALEYVGNYAIEIQDVSKYTKAEILEYNLVDALGTFYLWEKYQEERFSRPYVEIFQPSMYPLLKMMLVGLPMDATRVSDANTLLAAKQKVLREQIQANVYVIEYTKRLKVKALIDANSKLKKLVKLLEDFDGVEFNPASNIQLADMLFDMLELPVLDKTKSGNPAVGGAVLKDLVNHTQDQDILDLLTFVMDLSEATKINGTFIKAFLKEKDFLHGNLRLGGTQSGRLSSNNPNLTNLPAHGAMGKLIKSCIKAPDGWLFAGADFGALEERVGAILSQDPNRIKVYTEGFDGHSMRAFKYFGDQMPDIQAAVAKADMATTFWVNEAGEYCCD